MPSNAVIARLSVAALALCLAGSTARGERAQSLYDDQEYEAAIAAADRVLTSSPGKRSARIDALRVKAASLAVLGKDAEATATYEALLDLAPGFQLPASASPRIRGVFGSARARWQARREGALRMRLGAAWTALRLSVQTPLEGHGGRRLQVSAALTDPKAIASEVALFYRRVGSKRFSTTSVKARSGRNILAIPGAVTASRKPYQLELYVQVVHASGVTLRRYGSAASPRRLAVRAGLPPKPRPITKRWWFWSGVAAAVIATPFIVDRIRDVGPQTIEGRLP